MEPKVTIKVVVKDPPKGFLFGMQKGKGGNAEVVQERTSKGTDMTFECVVRVGKNRVGGTPNFLGPFAQGTPARRFVYVCSWEALFSGDTGSSRRAKIHLSPISWKLIQEAEKKNAPITASFDGTANDGAPFCASVEPLEDWRVGQ